MTYPLENKNERVQRRAALVSLSVDDKQIRLLTLPAQPSLCITFKSALSSVGNLWVSADREDVVCEWHQRRLASGIQ